MWRHAPCVKYDARGSPIRSSGCALPPAAPFFLATLLRLHAYPRETLWRHAACSPLPQSGDHALVAFLRRAVALRLSSRAPRTVRAAPGVTNSFAFNAQGQLYFLQI
jgi:hypothetical protein